MVAKRELLVIDLGLIEYGEAHKLQIKLTDLRMEKKIPDVLLLLEHPHVITLGRRSTPEDVRENCGIPVIRVERGGRATYHGPGQLVGYPIVDIIGLGVDVKAFVHGIEEAIILTLREFGLEEAGRREGYPGVWIHGRKIASIGLGIRKWITYHGFALNVNVDLKYFGVINPCGLSPEIITSMNKELGKNVNMNSVKKVMARCFAEVFGYEKRELMKVDELFATHDI